MSLPQKDCHELLRQERLLELRDRQSDYLWSAAVSSVAPVPVPLSPDITPSSPTSPFTPTALFSGNSTAVCSPDHIKAQTVRELPVSEQIEAGKYAGMPWDIDPTTIETLLPALAGMYSGFPSIQQQVFITSR